LVVVSRAEKQALAATTSAMPASGGTCGRRGGRAGRAAHWMRSASSSHTGVSWPGRKGSLPRSVWLSSGLWKSLPREAARPNSRALSA
jgi:hypothetical protein